MNTVPAIQQSTWICLALLTVAEWAPAQDAVLPPPVQRSVDFSKDVYPLLENRCFECHRGANPDSGVRLDHHAKLLGETDGVPLLITRHSADSRLIHRVAGILPEKLMPPPDSGPRLNEEEIGVLRAWIDQGAQWDEGLLPDPNRQLAQMHWAFQPIERPQVPAGAVNPIDAFIQAHHQRLNLTAASRAPKRTLIRRLYLVLHGLPPTPDEVRQFLNDSAPDAWSRLVERVLDSSHYGERIARHWLDSARWAESEGFAQNNDRAFAWRYRDYVIDSFNRDKPYSDFLRQQIAGDELEPYSDENLIATGFLAAARVSADDLHFYRVENDMHTDIVNTLTSTVLGLTVGCSQCHDHKFDPISQRDFYRLQAFFRRGLPGNLVLPDPTRPDDLERMARTLLEYDLQVRQRVLSEGFDEQPDPIRSLLHTQESQRSPEQERAYRPERISLNIRVAGCNGFRLTDDEKKQLEDLRKQVSELAGQVSQTWGFYSPVTSPHAVTTLPMTGNFPLLHDKRRLAEQRSYLLARGQIFEPVAIVSPGWPAALGPTDSPKIDSRPRTALAEWLTNRENPLTARVWVNRIWQFHFGQGLVDTPGNFGVRGSQPSHPLLLDWLASELVDHDWSTKHIHRLIVNSQTWQQSSLGTRSAVTDTSEQARTIAGTESVDAENRFLWCWPRRRLESEAIRDSMLVASGELERTIGGPGVPVSEEINSSRRGVYLFQKRDAPPAMQALFDGPTAMAEACVSRQVSTSPIQSLFLLNNGFSLHRSQALASRVRNFAGTDVLRQVDTAFELALGRPPDEVERAEAKAFLEENGIQPLEGENSAGNNASSPASSAHMATGHLSLWLRADEGVLAGSGDAARDKDPVATWVDQIAGDNRVADRLVQETDHRQPRYVSSPGQQIAGLPVIRFEGGAFGKSDHFLSAPSQDELNVSDGYTLFAVVRFNGKGQRNEVIFMKARNGGNDIGALGLIRMATDGRISVGQNISGQWADRLQSSRPAPDNTPLLIAVHWNSAQLTLDVFSPEGRFSSDSVNLSGLIDSGVGGRVSVGGYTDAFSDDGERLNGDIGELLYYRAALSDDQRDRTAHYLRNRWLTTRELTPLEVLSQALLNLNEFLYIE